MATPIWLQINNKTSGDKVPLRIQYIHQSLLTDYTIMCFGVAGYWSNMPTSFWTHGHIFAGDVTIVRSVLSQLSNL